MTDALHRSTPKGGVAPAAVEARGEVGEMFEQNSLNTRNKITVTS